MAIISASLGFRQVTYFYRSVCNPKRVSVTTFRLYGNAVAKGNVSKYHHKSKET